MSADTGSVWVSICGIAVVVGFLIILAGFLVVRVLRMSIFGLGMMAVRVVSESQTEETPLDRRRTAPLPSSRDLRAQAQSLDFDAAVARRRENPSAPIPPAPSRPLPPPDMPAGASGELRRRRQRSGEQDEDGILSEFMDGDGDGLLG
jgi:hypothetical protein